MGSAQGGSSAADARMTEATAAFASAVRYFVKNFGPSEAAGKHFALRIVFEASQSIPGASYGVVGLGLATTFLEIKNVDTGETGRFILNGLDIGTSGFDIAAALFGVGAPDLGPSVSIGPGPWVHFDTEERVDLADFAGFARIASASFADLEAKVIQFDEDIDVDQPSLLDDLLYVNSVNIKDSETTSLTPESGVGVSWQPGALHLTDTYQGTVDQSRSLFAGVVGRLDPTDAAPAHTPTDAAPAQQSRPAEADDDRDGIPNMIPLPEQPATYDDGYSTQLVSPNASAAVTPAVEGVDYAMSLPGDDDFATPTAADTAPAPAGSVDYAMSLPGDDSADRADAQASFDADDGSDASYSEGE
jgi:hypothetical protein